MPQPKDIGGAESHPRVCTEAVIEIASHSPSARAVRRAMDAVDRLVAQTGGTSMRLANPIQRFSRDCHVALGQAADAADPVYVGYGPSLYGEPAPASVKI